MDHQIRDSSSAEAAHSPARLAQTDSHPEIHSEPLLAPLIYPTFEDWRTTIPRFVLDSMTLEQQYESHQRLILLLTNLSAREMPDGESPIPFPDYAIIPQSGRPTDAARATDDFVDTQDWQHDLRISECRLAKMKEEYSGQPTDLSAEAAKISRLKELIQDASDHFERQGLKSTVLFKEFTIMKDWKKVLESGLRLGRVAEGFSSKQEMNEVLQKLKGSIVSRESQLVEEGILPLVQAPQTAKRLAANILTTSDSAPVRANGTEEEDEQVSPKGQ